MQKGDISLKSIPNQPETDAQTVYSFKEALVSVTAAKKDKAVETLSGYVEATPHSLFSRCERKKNVQRIGDGQRGRCVPSGAGFLILLLTTGIVGMVLYLLVVVMSFRIFCFRRGALPYIMTLSAYLLTGTVLFEQITNFPLMLALLGIGVREADRSAIL